MGQMEKCLATIAVRGPTSFRAGAAPRRAACYRRLHTECSVDKPTLAQRASQAAAAVLLSGALLAGGERPVEG